MPILLTALRHRGSARSGLYVGDNQRERISPASRIGRGIAPTRAVVPLVVGVLELGVRTRPI